MSNISSPVIVIGFSELLAIRARQIRERNQQEDPALARRVEAAHERTAQEMIEPTSTGYELKSEVK